MNMSKEVIDYIDDAIVRKEAVIKFTNDVINDLNETLLTTECEIYELEKLREFIMCSAVPSGYLN